MARKEKKPTKYEGRDKSRDKEGVKAQRRNARRAKGARRQFESSAWE